MGKKTRMGRPPKAAATKHTDALYLRLTPADRATLEAGAAGAGKKLTVWARDVLLKAAKRVK